MRALVTGGTGFLGGHLVERLLARGDEVTCLVRSRDRLGPLEPLAGRLALAEGTFVPGEGSDDALRDALGSVEVVYHIAGLTRRTRKERDAFYRVNRDGTAHVAGLAREHAPSLARLILASSLAAVGPSKDGEPLTESSPCDPLTDYGRSKREGEVALMETEDAPPWAIVRLPGVYGPRDENMVELFRVIRRGTRPAGRRRACFIHVLDACDALIACAEHPDASGEILHATGGSPTLGELGTLAAAALGRRAIPLPLPRLPVLGVAALSQLVGGFLDVGKAREWTGDWPVSGERIRERVGWEPRIPLSEGLTELARWYREAGWL